ncbi:MAG: porin [Vicinamibacterales bacterium]
MTYLSAIHSRLCLLGVALALVVVPSARASASSDALLKLLRILRDRGAITAAEYEELRLAAEDPAPPAGGTPGTTPVATAGGGAAAGQQAQAAAQDTDIAVKKVLAGKWYERLGLRGYTQLRFTAVRQGDGPSLEVPADKSANDAESLVIRRGRLVVSGDAASHLYLYAQADFNGSTGASEYSLQMRDLYADVAFDRAKAFRVRLGQSKVPYGFVNMQSSSNRAPFERPDAMNSAVEGERDYGVYFMWAPPVARRRFSALTSRGLKGSGDYGVAAIGVYNGQGPNRSDQNGEPHVVARYSYPFELASGQFLELGVQAYHGRFVTPVQALSIDGRTLTPARPDDGVTDQRVAVTAVWYPQPFGVEAEWNIGRGPEISADLSRIERRRLQGGYVQVAYRSADGGRSLFPFGRWQYYDGGRKFARNAPHDRVNELDLGLEFARWSELELTMVYTRTFERTRTGSFPFATTRGANRVGFQAQWNY